jgi:hypothetical protein
MITLALLALLLGWILAQFFKVLVLVPASGLLIPFVLVLSVSIRVGAGAALPCPPFAHRAKLPNSGNPYPGARTAPVERDRRIFVSCAKTTLLHLRVNA